MRQGQDMVNNATQLGERVCLTTAPRGQDAIHRELQNMKDDWNSFANSVNDMEANLEACISKWLDLDDEYQRFQQWIDKMDARVKSLAENKPDLQRKQQQLRDGEVSIFQHIKCIPFYVFLNKRFKEMDRKRINILKALQLALFVKTWLVLEPKPSEIIMHPD